MVGAVVMPGLAWSNEAPALAGTLPATAATSPPASMATAIFSGEGGRPVQEEQRDASNPRAGASRRLSVDHSV
jgi:hypothetical protein